MNFKMLLREIITLLIIAIIAWLIVFGFSTHVRNLDVHLHDTYLVLSGASVFIPLCFMLVTIVYFIKAIVPKFNNKPGFVILLASNFLLLLKLLKFFTLANLFAKGGWIAYPPIATQPDTAAPLGDTYTMFNTPTKILFTVTIFFIVLLVIGAVITGKNWKTKTHES